MRHIKGLIRSLGANKSTEAMLRVTSASDIVIMLGEKFRKSLGVRSHSGQHTKPNSKDREKVKDILRGIRPMRYTSARKFVGFKKKIAESPFKNINRSKMRDAMRVNIERSLDGISSRYEDELVESELEDSDVESDYGLMALSDSDSD